MDISSYHHPSSNGIQEPDTKPGDYFVSMTNNGGYSLLLGPFPHNHTAALELVSQARSVAEDIDPRAAFLSFGTCRLEIESGRFGKLNEMFDLDIGEPL